MKFDLLLKKVTKNNRSRSRSLVETNINKLQSQFRQNYEKDQVDKRIVTNSIGVWFGVIQDIHMDWKVIKISKHTDIDKTKLHCRWNYGQYRNDKRFYKTNIELCFWTIEYYPHW